MPSVLGTLVTANYGRMTSQDTYGGVTFSNFATRNLSFIKVVASSSSVDFTAAPSTDPDSDSLADWQDSLSPFAVAVRTIQHFAEIYFVGTPATSGSNSAFVVAVAMDTATNGSVAAPNTQQFSHPTLTDFGLIEAAIATATGTSASNITLTQLTATGSSIAGTVTYT